MAQLDEKSLKKHIKTAEFLPVYLFYGDEDYLKKVYIDTIVSKCVAPAFESLNFVRLEGKNTLLNDVIEQASIIPMMSEKRCIVIEDYKLDSLLDKEISAFQSYLESGYDTCVIIFLQKNPEFTPKKNMQIINLIDKFGAVCTLKKRSGSDLIKPLIKSAEKQGCILSTQIATYLVNVVGDDFNVLINELNKVCNFAHQGEITRQHIDAVAVKTDDAKIYYLTNALMQKDFDKAYKVLHTLLRQKIEPGYILGTLISAYVDMYRAKISLYCGERADSLSVDYAYNKTAFRLVNAGKDASRIEIPTIRKCLDVLSEADMKLKSGSDDQVILLEQLMVKLFLVQNGEKV